MILNPNFIYYSCIAKGTTILAHYRSNEPKIEELAAECLAKAPPHHSIFSHSIKKRTYCFLIDQPFVYFAIFDEGLVKSESLWFLNRMKCAFDEIIKGRSMVGSDDFAPLCFQAQFDPIFRETMALDLDLGNPGNDGNGSRNPSLDSVKGKRSVMLPLFGNPVEGLKKKKRVGLEANGMDAATENKVDACDDVNGCTREFHLSVPPKGVVNDRQKAKQIWKKHVWVVLLLDVFVCTVLFVIWLWVCAGLKCMES